MIRGYNKKQKQATEREPLSVGWDRYPLLQLLLCEFWFGVAFVVFVVFGFALALCLPKIWRTTPDGFFPVVKVSVVDMVQSWSLKRTALKAEAHQDRELALFSWQAAVGNNIADPAMIRHWIRYVTSIDDQLARAPMVIGQVNWLLRLTQTNRIDVELAAEVWHKYRMPSASLSLLEPYTNGFTDSMAAIYLKSLFEVGRIDQFAELWGKCPEPLRQDDCLKLYHAAYLAGWQPEPLAGQGRHSLAVLGNAELEIMALRLSLQVNAKLRDIFGYQKILAQLSKKTNDMVQDHIVYWKLLAGEGRLIEAAGLARQFTNAPLTATEAAQLSIAYSALDLHAKARQTLTDGVHRFAYEPALWQSLAESMIETRQWLELQALALQMREERSTDESLVGYSRFLEGRAQLGQSRPSDAAENFKSALDANYRSMDMPLRLADNLTKLGYAALVKDFLARFEINGDKHIAYWQAVNRAACELKDESLLLRSSARAHELNPQSAIAMNNYAAALLLLRQRPDKAVKMTKQLTLELPGSAAMAYNHSLALLLNQRTQEAEDMLKTIQPEQLKPQEANRYNLAWFEVYLQKKQWDLALATAARIETKDLFNSQKKWFESALKSLPQK